MSKQILNINLDLISFVIIIDFTILKVDFEMPNYTKIKNTVVLTKIKFLNYKYRSHLKVSVKFKITLYFQDN